MPDSPMSLVSMTRGGGDMGAQIGFLQEGLVNIVGGAAEPPRPYQSDC